MKNSNTLTSFFPVKFSGLLAMLACALGLQLGLASCGAAPGMTEPAPLSTGPRTGPRTGPGAGLGVIGVAASGAPPALRVIALPAGRLKGAASGAGAAMASAVNGCLDIDPTYLCVAAALVASPWIAAGGAVYGAVSAKPEEEVAAAQRAIESALARLPHQTALAGRVDEAARRAGIASLLLAPPSQGTAWKTGTETGRPAGSPPPAAGSASPVREGPTTILEIEVVEVRLGKRPAVNPDLPLLIQATTRLLRAADHGEWYRRDFTYRGERRMRFTAWAAGQGRALRAELETGYNLLARQIVAELFTAAK